MSGEQKFQIFRGADARGTMEAGILELGTKTSAQEAGVAKLMEAGFRDGGEVKVLVNIPGYSVTHVWFKKDYPMLLHSHSADCLYCVIAGSLALGTETLGPQDSFFVPAGTAYAYRPGPEGVELLEFRHESRFDFKNLAKSPAFYDKALKTVAANREAWRTAKPPAINA
jgi:mannose-6-phosphate isomerase-like protein (cupin superfamily)